MGKQNLLQKRAMFLHFGFNPFTFKSRKDLKRRVILATLADWKLEARITRWDYTTVISRRELEQDSSSLFLETLKEISSTKSFLFSNGQSLIYNHSWSALPLQPHCTAWAAAVVLAPAIPRHIEELKSIMCHIGQPPAEVLPVHAQVQSWS